MSSRSPLLWDLPTRLVHWGLAACVVLNLFVWEEGETPHQWTGYVAVAFVAFRSFWGWKGGAASRFTAFPLHPRKVFAFLKSGMRDEDYEDRHNPLASWVYVSIWLLILALGVTGWMMGLDAYWGEEWLEDLHSVLSTILQVLVLIHLLGVFGDSFRHRRATWLGMIRGRRG